MSHSKRNSFFCASVCCTVGCLVLLFPLLILQSFSIALFYLTLLSTFSTLNILNTSKKSITSALSHHFSMYDDDKDDKRLERKEFSIIKATIILGISISIYYVVSVLFGAPVFEAYSATLYFSVLMTVLTTYPLVWYFSHSDSLLAVLRIISESRLDNISENHLQSQIIWTICGSWMGAFPIPLDWDRPWQTWPITCCIGATLGYSAIHLVIGFKLFYGYFKDKKRTGNRSV